MKPEFQRIVSLVPCLTHTLLSLRGEEQLVGVTRYCPTGHDGEIVGGIHDLDFDHIERLSPDLILVDAEENGMANILKLAENHEVLAVTAETMFESMDTVSKFSKLTGRPDLGETLSGKYKLLAKPVPSHSTAAVVVWPDPLRCASADTYCGSLLEHLGVTTVVPGPGYPEMSLEKLQTLGPDLLLLPSEPFDFTPKHQQQFSKLLSNTGSKVLRVDGKALFWYGSYMLDALESLPRTLRQ